MARRSRTMITRLGLARGGPCKRRARARFDEEKLNLSSLIKTTTYAATVGTRGLAPRALRVAIRRVVALNETTEPTSLECTGSWFRRNYLNGERTPRSSG